MSGHAKLSPSRRHRYARCPGSVQAESKYPEKPSGPAAIDGTHSHTLLDFCVTAGLIDPIIMIGSTMKDHEGDFVVDMERAQRVKLAIDHIKSRVALYDGKCQVIAERKVNPEWLVGRKDMAGTADITIIADAAGVIEIWDFKDGFEPVEAKGNEQMEVYALGALAELRLPINSVYPYDTVVMGIIQPRMTIKGLSPISFDTVTVKHVLDLVGQMVVEAHLTEQPDAKLVPGAKQCRYCAAAGCSARAEAALNGVGIMTSTQQVLNFPNLSLPSFLQVESKPQSVDLVQQSADKDPANMSNEELAKIYETVPLLKQMIKNVEEEMLARMKAGRKIEGYKVIHGRGSRAWSLTDDEMAQKLIGMGVPKSAVYETSLVSPAKAEKLTWEKVSKGEKIRKQLSKRQLETMDKEYVTHGKGALTVVPESDERQSAIIDAAPLFSAVEAPASTAVSVPDWMK